MRFRSGAVAALLAEIAGFGSPARRVSHVAAAALVLCGCGPSAPPPQRPNLLLVSVDTLRADALACYGGEPAVGAGLCALFAPQGIRYRWAFAAAPYTAPSIASLLTSRYPSGHGVTQSALSLLADDLPTLAESLRGQGYTTAAFVSNPVLDRGRRLDRGFDTWDQQMTRRERNRPGFLEREAASTTDAALAFAEVALREPWFLWVHYQDPHGPYEPPDAPTRRDPPGAVRLPRLADDSGRGGIPAYQALPGLFSEAAYLQRYRDEIAYLEDHVVRLVRGLDGRFTPPAVALTADHGEAFGEDGYYFAHGHSPGLDQVRVPLLLRPPAAPASAAAALEPAASGRETPAAAAAPASPRPAVVDAPVSLIDVAPTLLSWAGVAAPAGFEGRPLPGATALASAPDPSRTVFAEHGARAAAIRGDRFYARDRRDDESRRRELGREAPPRPPRAARLDDDRLPPYRAPEPSDAALEEALSRFLAQPARPPQPAGAVPAELQEPLRQLGYAE